MTCEKVLNGSRRQAGANVAWRRAICSYDDRQIVTQIVTKEECHGGIPA